MDDLEDTGGNDEFLTPELLCERYYDSVHRHLFYRTRSVWLADDLTQDTMLLAIYHLDDCRERAKVRGWLMVIADNVFKRHVEKECRIRRILQDCRERAVIHVAPPCDLAAMNEAVENLLSELAAMPQQLREAVTARYLLGLDYEKAALHLNTSVTTHRMRLLRANRRLARRLRRHCLPV